MSNPTSFQQLAESRRSIYSLNKNLPISQDDVVQIIEHAMLHTPSAFNSQSTRLVVLLGNEHEKLWQITEDILKNIINDNEKFQPTAQKLAGFKAGAGTILFFEDNVVIKDLQEQFPAYAKGFPVWSEHTNAMHQYAIWTALANVNIGANLQHYSPIIDEKVAETWQINPNWQLVAQMVFGGITQPAGEKAFAPLDSRLKVFGK